ncbi:MAG: hypothetical protein KGI29_01545 [Pseudomonadota bacterium]|nr:hypothetical protein [Pseudomonadota bacterium]MDE3037922.1 hypothetical protein [Pseudomonadota bacterium]
MSDKKIEDKEIIINTKSVAYKKGTEVGDVIFNTLISREHLRERLSDIAQRIESELHTQCWSDRAHDMTRENTHKQLSQNADNVLQQLKYLTDISKNPQEVADFGAGLAQAVHCKKQELLRREKEARDQNSEYDRGYYYGLDYSSRVDKAELNAILKKSSDNFKNGANQALLDIKIQSETGEASAKLSHVQRLRYQADQALMHRQTYPHFYP